MTSKKQNRIGVFGGTFDPIHIGHLIAAQEAVEKLRLDNLIFMPTAIPPHKNRSDLTSAQDRLRMVMLATTGVPYFQVSDLEIRRGGRSYSIETIKELRQTYGPLSTIYFITGADSIPELPKWKDIKELLRICRFTILTRPRCELSLATLTNFFSERELARLRRGVLEIPLIDVSSTEIRRRVRAGRPIKYLVPDAVEKYVRRHRLYLSD